MLLGLAYARTLVGMATLVGTPAEYGFMVGFMADSLPDWTLIFFNG